MPVEKSCRFFECFSEGMKSDTFLYGYLSGFVFFILIALLLFVLYLLFFRSNRVPSISIQTQLGILMISANAISDLVKSLDSSFKNLEIGKVCLYRERRYVRMEVMVNFIPGSGSMVDTTNMLQGKIMDALKESFGVTSIKKIYVRVKRTPVIQSDF